MCSFFFRKFLFIPFCMGLGALEISPAESEMIGKQIFQNECSSKTDRLVWWNVRENFASLGIGHFIWYPEGIQGPFEETFPQLLAFFKENKVALPKWLEEAPHCPWNTREELFTKSQEQKRKELQEILAQTMALQTTFIGMRLDATLPKVVNNASDTKKAHIEKQIAQLQSTPAGKFALIDYLHFKGDGTVLTERYDGKGWGLQQVLELMEDNPDNPLEEFIKTAKLLLKQRVKASPPERKEEQWLPGWLARVERYAQATSKAI